MEKTNYLIKGLAEYKYINDYKLVFNTDFRVWIRYEELMQDEKLKAENLAISVLTLCFRDGLDILNYIDLETAFNQILWFFTMGDFDNKTMKKTNDLEKENDVKEKSKIIYSFTYDWSSIYGAFMQCYKIDLFDASMHWWKFKALFNSLSEDTQFAKILSYRSISISSKMSKEEKKFYRSMKKLYGLPDTRSEEEKERSFAKSLYSSMKD